MMLPGPLDALIPGNPMTDANYLTSPLETLAESLQDLRQDYISLHDIAEAYNSLTARIRSQAHTIIDAQGPLPAFEKVKEYSQYLFQSLQRDLHCALIDPFYEARRASTMESLPTTIPEHEMEYARNLTLVCHHTLCFVSVLFAFPPLFTILPSGNIDLLFDHVLTLASSRHLPTPEAQKTLALAMWVIRSQQLPSAVLASRKSQIVAILKDTCNTIRIKQWTLDALKAIHNLFKAHDSIFTSALPSLLPSILTHLISESADCRMEAAYALSGAALATIRMDTHNSVTESSANLVHSFIDAHTSTRNPDVDTARLSYLMAEALSSTNPVDGGPLWALVVLASFTILSGPQIFSHQRLFRLALYSLSPASVHIREDIRALHPQAWRTLVWAFSRLPIEAGDRITGESGGSPDTTRERAFRLIKQGMNVDIGIAIVAALLGSTHICDRGSADLPKALDIIQDMGARQATSNIAFALLVRLLDNSPPRPTASHNRNIVSLRMFDGSVLHAKCSPTTLFTEEAAVLGLDHVRQLSESEIFEYWDHLLDIWVQTVKNSLQDTTSLPPREIFDAWQTLLLSKTELTQGGIHLTTDSVVTDRVASTISHFIVETQSTLEQIRQLRLVKKLWSTTKNVFSAPSLRHIANPIFATLLDRQFPMVDGAIQEAWGQLSAELYTACDSSVYASYISKEHGELEIKRRLWMVIAKSYEDRPDDARWVDMVAFLTMPFGRWVMSDSEFEIWESTLRGSFEDAGQDSFRPIHVIEYFFESLGSGPAKLLATSPKVLTIILSYIDIDNDHPHTKVFSIIDDILCALYPPLPEVLSTSLDIYRLLGETIVAAGPLLIVPLLLTMQKSLSLWIRDELNLLLDDEYNKLLSYAYCNFLDILSNEAPSLRILQGLSRFLTSSFSHIPPPAIGPAAFERYWRTTFHGLAQFSTFYPPEIKDCLKGLDTFKDGSLAVGLSFETETQISTTSVIPDSQPSFHAPEASSIYEGDVSHFPSSMGDSRLSTRSSLLPPTPITPPPRQPSIQLPLSPINRQVSVRAKPTLRATKMPIQLHEHTTRLDKGKQVADTAGSSAHETRRQISKRRKQTPEPPAATSDDRSPKSPITIAQRVQKRRRLNPKPRTATGNSRREFLTRPKTRSSSRPSSEPLPPTRAVRVAPHASSQPPPATNTRRFFDGVEVPSVREIMGRRPYPPWRPIQQDNMAMRCDDQPSTPGGTSPPLASSPPDYESWEAGALSDDLRQIQRELLGSDNVVPESDLGDSSDTDMRNASEDSPQSPSLDAWARRHGRSQTVPNLASTHTNQLRRNQTTAASRLDTLQRAYAAFTEGVSQVPVQDLVQATHLVHKIGAVLSEHMGRKLGEDGR